jgi:hypothetical protein
MNIKKRNTILDEDGESPSDKIGSRSTPMRAQPFSDGVLYKKKSIINHVESRRNIIKNGRATNFDFIEMQSRESSDNNLKNAEIFRNMFKQTPVLWLYLCTERSLCSSSSSN